MTLNKLGNKEKNYIRKKLHKKTTHNFIYRKFKLKHI